MSATKEKHMVPGEHVIGTFDFARMVRTASLLSWAPMLPQGKALWRLFGMGLVASESPSKDSSRQCVLVILWSSGLSQPLPQNQHPVKIWKKENPIRHFRYLKVAVLFPRELNTFLPSVTISSSRPCCGHSVHCQDPRDRWLKTSEM